MEMLVIGWPPVWVWTLSTSVEVETTSRLVTSTWREMLTPGWGSAWPGAISTLKEW